ncbi:hypothetical protein GCM10027157_08350 [Corynebacterium aquatimens]
MLRREFFHTALEADDAAQREAGLHQTPRNQRALGDHVALAAGEIRAIIAVLKITDVIEPRIGRIRNDGDSGRGVCHCVCQGVCQGSGTSRSQP